MKKQIISKDEEKLNIVILRNDSMDICVKGISKCHPEDEYDREKGIHIANTKAWIKYYDALYKNAKHNMEFHQEMADWYKEKLDQDNAVCEMAQTKIPSLREELIKVIGD